MTGEEPPLTLSFRDTVADRARRNPDFVAALVEEARQALTDGDAETARTLLRHVASAALPHSGNAAP